MVVLDQGQGPAPFNQDIFQATFGVPAIRFFLRHPDFVPIYFATLQQMMDEVFAPEVIEPLLDKFLKDYVPAQAIQEMKDYAANRVAYVRGVIPLATSIQIRPASILTGKRGCCIWVLCW